MKLLKFLFTARMSFVLFALLAFVATVVYLGWTQHQAGIHVNAAPQTHKR